MSRIITKNAIVTGAAKRLGRDIALELAKNGWNIAVHYNTTEPKDVLKEIAALGVKAVAVKGDLLNFDEVSKLIAKAAKQLGEITLLVNNASIFEKIKFMESDENVFDSHMDIHVKAPFFLAQEFHLQCHSGGQIINIVDSFVCRNKSTYFTYLLAKKALRDLSKMLAVELAPAVRVNAVLPGAIEEYRSNFDQDFINRRLGNLPMKKLVTSKDVTNAIMFLTNSNLTGQEIFVDSGEQLL
jgi:pteridine reductase